MNKKFRKDYSEGIYPSLGIIEEDGQYWIVKVFKRASVSCILEDGDGMDGCFDLQTAITNLHNVAHQMHLVGEQPVLADLVAASNAIQAWYSKEEWKRMTHTPAVTLIASDIVGASEEDQETAQPVEMPTADESMSS